MAHETHNDSNSEQSKSIVSFKSSFWLVVILVGLFIAALNFIKVMGNHEEGKGEKAETTEMHGAAKEGSEAKEKAAEAAKETPAAEANKAEAPKTEEHKAEEHK